MKDGGMALPRTPLKQISITAKGASVISDEDSLSHGRVWVQRPLFRTLRANFFAWILEPEPRPLRWAIPLDNTEKFIDPFALCLPQRCRLATSHEAKVQ